MGRKKITITHLEETRIRRITFKKRRFGLLKKAMQLAALTDCHVELRVYNKEDSSLMDYFSSKRSINFNTDQDVSGLHEYVNFSNLTNNETEILESNMSKAGYFNEDDFS